MTRPLLPTIVAQLLAQPIVMPQRVVYLSNETYALANRERGKEYARARRAAKRAEAKEGE